MSREAALPIMLPERALWLRALVNFVKAKPLGTAGGVVLIMMVLVAILAPLLAPFDPTHTYILQRLSPPSSRYLLGSDELGRDVLSRVVYGARISLYVGLIATFFGTMVGALLGITSAYWGGRLDMLLQRLMDVMLSFPILILAIGIMAVLGPSMNNVIIALAVSLVPAANRVIRSTALAAKEFQYVEAARATGCKPQRILWTHVMPNCLAPYIVIASVMLGQAITIEASLSFLGLGVPPPAPSWGRSLAESMPFMDTSPWLTIFPAIALSVSVFGINLLGDALRDTLDPRLKRR